VGSFVPVYLVVFVIIILVFFDRDVVAKNSDIQTTRTMLLYLPVLVIARAKGIKALVDGILARDADGLGGGGGAPGSSKRVAPAHGAV
jgi:hypothetical protein